MTLTIFLGCITALIFAMLWTEGLWSNALSMFNAFFSAVIASNLYEPVANFMDGQADSLTYFWDFLALWLVFALSFAILRSITDQISQTRVRFRVPVELGGRAVFGALTAWFVVTFILFSLHTAPTARSSFGGGFQPEPKSTNFFVGPDKMWLGFLQSRSGEGGAMATSTPNPFDPNSEFILKYGQRRQNFSEFNTLAVKNPRGRR